MSENNVVQELYKVIEERKDKSYRRILHKLSF